MERIRALIVDDEKPARRRLAELLRRESDVEVIGEARDGREAVALVQAQSPDLMFLDIQMPDLDGFAVLAALEPDQAPVTVFVTAYDRYAIQAFEARALDYLLKPFSDQRFVLDDRAAADPEARYLERLVLKSSGRVTFVGVEDVDWIEAAGMYVTLHAGPRAHLYRSSLAHLLQRLDPKRFVRVHRSIAVNTERIRELQPRSHGDYTVVLKDGTELVMSRGFRPQFEHWLRQPL
jgi:two-component system LytT family response regulator